LLGTKSRKAYLPAPSPSLLSRATFSWVMPLLSRARKGGSLSVDDLLTLPKSAQSDAVWDSFQQGWNPSSSERLIWGLNRIHAKYFWPLAPLRLAADACSWVSPIILRLLVDHLASRETSPPWKGYLYGKYRDVTPPPVCTGSVTDCFFFSSSPAYLMVLAPLTGMFLNSQFSYTVERIAYVA
jgi:hypothetical protein